MSGFTQLIKDGWARRAATAERARNQEQTKLLPANLQDQILGACEKEREALLQRVGWIDAEIDRMDHELAEARIAEQDAAETYPQPPARRRRWDGQVVEIQRQPIMVRGKAAIASGQVVAGLDRYRVALQEERTGRLGQLAEVAAVERQTRSEIVSGLLAITRNWQNRLEIGVDFLPPAVHGWVPVDSAGNELTPLQAEALATSGRGTKEG